MTTSTSDASAEESRLFDDAMESIIEDNLFETKEEVVQPNASNADPSLETSYISPSQDLQELDNIFSLGSQEFYLNNCGSKRLVIGITCTVVPNLKVVFKLHDLKNGWYIQFSKKTWDTIVRHETDIAHLMTHNVPFEVFDNRKIRAETQLLYNQGCVRFVDVTETAIVMMEPTFAKMMSLKDEVDNVYAELTTKLAGVSKRIKLFMDVTFFQLLKSNNIDSRHNYNWLTLIMDKQSDFLRLNKAIGNVWELLGKFINHQEVPETTDEQ